MEGGGKEERKEERKEEGGGGVEERGRGEELPDDPRELEGFRSCDDLSDRIYFVFSLHHRNLIHKKM